MFMILGLVSKTIGLVKWYIFIYNKENLEIYYILNIDCEIYLYHIKEKFQNKTTQ